jgi:hypothetical protein
MTIADKSRDFQIIKQAALDQNWRVERTAGNHYMFRSPNGATSVTAGGNYKDRHALRNLVAELRRGGFVPPKKMR